MADTNDDGGGEWETAPTRHTKKNQDKTKGRGGRGQGSGRGGGRGGQEGGVQGGGGNRGFNGWAKPNPPTPTTNASWPSPPYATYTSKESEATLQHTGTTGPTSDPAMANAPWQTKAAGLVPKNPEELNYLNAVPKLRPAANAPLQIEPTADPIALSEHIGEAVKSTIDDNKGDAMTGTLASTAAMTLLSSVDAFGLDDAKSNVGAKAPDVNNKGSEDNIESKASPKDEPSVMDFKAMCKQPLADLMADYGEQDVDFDKMVIPGSGDDGDHGTKRSASKVSDATPAETSADNTSRSNDRGSSGVLVPHGKAPIHIELVSYGHHYGVPSEATARGGYSRARPLPPFDVRDISRAPHHVAKLSGLSYHVKRELLNPKEIEEEDAAVGGAAAPTEATDKDVKTKKSTDKRSPVRRRADEVATEAATALAEAIANGYGHASPLDMTIYVGSEYGRHRSVVIVEAAAITLRNILRRNEEGRFGSTPVSVGTRHRDVDRAHRDEEAFGFDLRREAQAAKKKKEREERALEGREW